MATDLEKLVVQLSADIKQYQREMQKAQGVSAKQARAIENRFRKMNKNLDGIMSAGAKAVITPLAGISAALSIREVGRYADAWTGAKNSLAVAGVTGKEQVRVLDSLYQSAQANAAPVTALADLYGKAAQANDNLGASQRDLIKFTDGVAVALLVNGTSAQQASGALTQLGQLLGSARVQAEEFNSVNEGARPILMAVAAGLDKAGGSVSKLKQLVNDGEVSGQQFFQAFLKGLPKVEAMAENATTTIEQGITKVSNAFTKYIGETDEGLGATQRLVQGLTALADNFDQIADVTVKVASIIAAGLLGRSIAGMIVKLGVAAKAVTTFVSAIRAASTISGIAAAISGVSVAAGPIGAVIGVTAVGALMAYSAATSDASDAMSEFQKRQKAILDNTPDTGLAILDAAEKAKKALADPLQIPSDVGASAIVDGIEEGMSEIMNLRQELIQTIGALDDFRGTGIVSDDQINRVEALALAVVDGKASVKDLEGALGELAGKNVSLNVIIAEAGKVVDAYTTAAQAVRQLQGEVAAGALSRTSIEDRATRAGAEPDPALDAFNAGKAYIAEAKRQQSLTKDQLALEKEIARVRKDSAKDGASLTDAQVTEVAKGNLAAAASRSASGKSGKSSKASPEQRAVERYDDSTLKEIAGMKAETEQYTALTGTYDRYGLSIERAAKEAELLQALQNKGVKITPQLREQVKGLADDWYASADANTKAKERYDEFQQSVETAKSSMQDAFTGLITGAHDFNSALASVLSNLAEMAASKAFESLWSGSGLGDGTSSFLKALGFADGGYTGAGGKYQPAGVVHKGEYVMDAATVRKAGGPAAFDAIRRRVNGYAGGGYVGQTLPRSVQSQGGSSGGQHVTVGVEVDNNGNLQAYVKNVADRSAASMGAQINSALPARVQQITANPRRR